MTTITFSSQYTCLLPTPRNNMSESADKASTPQTSQNPHTEKVHQTEAQLQAIENEIRESQPLTSALLDLSSTLHACYRDASSKNFALGVDVLAKTYDKIRTIRGDGNCYYRAFLYNLCEQLLENATERERILKLVVESKSFVLSVGGYEEMAIEIFYDTLVEFLENLTTLEAMHTELTQENATSDYCTWYLRVLTATYLKADPDRFLPYLEDGYVDIYAYCQAQIEPMGKECAMVQVLALAEYVKVRVLIEYLDGHDIQGGKLAQHQFGPSIEEKPAALQLNLLYRPGHYDVLYLKKE